LTWNHGFKCFHSLPEAVGVNLVRILGRQRIMYVWACEDTCALLPSVKFVVNLPKSCYSLVKFLLIYRDYYFVFH